VVLLYQFEISPFCDKVRRILHYKEVPYRVVEIPPSEAASGRWKEISPTGKFPVLEDGSTRILDSTDIARHLEARHPSPALLPADPRDRALVHVLEDWADESLYFFEMTMRLSWPQNAARWVPELLRAEKPLVRRLMQPVVPRIVSRTTRSQGLGRKDPETVVAELGAHLDAIAALLGDGPWLVGDALSLADIAVYAQLFCIAGAVEGAEAIAARPVVGAWMERVDDATHIPADPAAADAHA
jgi:glutathione S-transferase